VQTLKVMQWKDRVSSKSAWREVDGCCNSKLQGRQFVRYNQPIHHSKGEKHENNNPYPVAHSDYRQSGSLYTCTDSRTHGVSSAKRYTNNGAKRHTHPANNDSHPRADINA